MEDIRIKVSDEHNLNSAFSTTTALKQKLSNNLYRSIRKIKYNDIKNLIKQKGGNVILSFDTNIVNILNSISPMYRDLVKFNIIFPVWHIKQITKIECEKRGLEFFPKISLNDFKNLKEINLNNNKLEKIYINCPVDKLYCSKNNIRLISCPKAEKIYCFDNAKNLKKYISKNCIAFGIP